VLGLSTCLPDQLSERRRHGARVSSRPPAITASVPIPAIIGSAELAPGSASRSAPPAVSSMITGVTDVVVTVGLVLVSSL
jgi:hypothetical protein